MDMVKRFNVYLVNLDPMVNGKPRTSRPCVVVSPDEMNRYLTHSHCSTPDQPKARFPHARPDQL